MINIFLAFVILTVAMYLAIKVVNVINARFNLLPKPDVIRPQSNKEQTVETLINSLQVVELSPINAPAINTGEFGTGAINDEVVNTTESLVEGVQTLAESAGETLTTLMEGLSHQ
ncbi:MAG: hypothetical protein RLZZ04_2502 [Cyanobacteriota bacterium]|jgi:hypothetical protein